MHKEWQGHKGEVLDSKNNFEVIECKKCQFKHIVPIPTEEELVKVYEDEYYSVEKPLYIERMKEDSEWWNLSYDDRYDSFEEFLDKNNRRILDIGSGPGLFLNRGKERGWEVTGIEPSKQAFEYSSKKLGLNIYNMFLNEDTKNDIGRFDVIHMSEVLEHVPNPKGLLNIALEKLNANGLICIVVPNDYNPFQNSLRDACGYDPWWVAPPHHINYYNFESLTRLLEKVGFKVVLRESTFPIDMFLLMGENYIENNILGRECHKMRKNMELNLAKAGKNNLKRKLYREYANIGLGREIMLIGQK
jgi:2-polyprenyl-3-methyl-5-hydroxy-6-metoxy-1,4-benzoquinol methylase